eukprot:TRINITY_DN21993_c0_g1_i2.p2 TRINITY_DN21993_c0_g1~~TRINITY_DN21993_c0_g1_i2.p2  ORF type:complete len:132 (+),score=35.27 TRINITY_DN21993_c0_g1_i2:187-582(+)
MCIRDRYQRRVRGLLRNQTMPEICEGVSFDVVAREWRCKWSGDEDKASLVACQKLVDENLAALKELAGVQSVQRVVCGGCLDFKIVTAISAEHFGAWETAEFAPEKSFLEHLSAIKGVEAVETQTYTLMTL